MAETNLVKQKEEVLVQELGTTGTQRRMLCGHTPHSVLSIHTLPSRRVQPTNTALRRGRAGFRLCCLDVWIILALLLAYPPICPFSTNLYLLFDCAMEAVFQFFGFGPKRFDARDGFSFRPFLKVSSMACSICRSILSLSMGTCRPRKRGRAGTPLCVLLFQYCLLSFLPPSTSCLDHRGFAAPPRPALFRDSRSTAWAFVNGFGVCRRQNAMKTVMNREEYWGKKQAGAWVSVPTPISQLPHRYHTDNGGSIFFCNRSVIWS